MPRNKIMMNEKHIIRMCLTLCGETLKSISEKVGIKPNALANQLGRPESTMTLTSVYAILDEMGFEIVVRDKDKKLGGVEYVIKERPESETEWVKIVANDQANAKIRRIEIQNPNVDIDKLKTDNAAAMLESLKK